MSSTPMPDSISKQFGYILKRAQQSLRTKMDLALRSHDLTMPQYAVLSAVEFSPGCSNADLAKAAFVSPQTMQAIIATMEKRGLLVRSADPEHGRRLITQITDLGEKTKALADETVLKIEANMIASLSKEQVDQATQTLLTCIENLTEN